MASAGGLIMSAIAGGAKAAGDIAGEQQKIDYQAQLLSMQEQRDMRIAEFNENLRQRGKQADVDMAIKNAPSLRDVKVEDEKAIGGARAGVELESKKAQAAADLEFQSKNIDTIAANKRRLALASHIVDPKISIQAAGDGRMMRIDLNSGKVLGYLTDPDTGEPVTGKKDIPESQMAAAKAYFKQAEEEAKMDPAQSAKTLKKGMDLLGIKQGADAGGPPPADKRVVGQIYQTPKGDMEWAGSGWKPVTKAAEPKATKPASADAQSADEPQIVKMEPAGSSLMGGKKFVATYSDGTTKLVSGDEAERQAILMSK